MEEHIEWSAFDKLKTFQKNCDGLNKQIMDLYKAIYLFNTEKHKFIYEWVKKHHPSWVKYSTITYDLKNNAEPNYQDDISAHIHEDYGEIWIGIMEYDPMGNKLAKQGFEVEDTYWNTHKVKFEDFK
jgi:sugar lactone lactonase YvrE